MPFSVHWNRPCSNWQFLLLIIFFYPRIPCRKSGSFITTQTLPHGIRVRYESPHNPNCWRCCWNGVVSLLACEIEWFGDHLETHWQIVKWIQKVKIFHNHTKDFAIVHYQLRDQSQFQKPKTKMSVVSTSVVWNNKPYPRTVLPPETINLPTRSCHTLWTLVTIDTQIILGFTFGTHLLNTYVVWYMLKRPITLFKVLCALHIA